MDASDRAKRRISQLAGHMRGNSGIEDQAWLVSGGSLCAVVCSASISSGLPRRDSRAQFARQASDSHGPYMQQVKLKQVSHAAKNEDRLPLPSSALGPERTDESPISSVGRSKQESTDISGPKFAAVAPLFGKPAMRTETTEKKLVTDNPGPNQNPVARSSPKSPSRPQTEMTSPQGALHAKDDENGAARIRKMSPSAATIEQTHSDGFGFEWFPRMDVVESGTAYVITIELPGVSADGIHVEVVRGSIHVKPLSFQFVSSHEWLGETGEDEGRWGRCRWITDDMLRLMFGAFSGSWFSSGQRGKNVGSVNNPGKSHVRMLPPWRKDQEIYELSHAQQNSHGSLIVTGSRATDWWKANSNGTNGGGTVYHRRELAQGPYRAVWRLPKNGDIDGITAEFIDGFLRVLVPKIKAMTYL